MGMAALEDKIAQHAVAEVLNRIGEGDFPDFSYGFRPGRGRHDGGMTIRRSSYGIGSEMNGSSVRFRNG